ncbi:MAG TPA: hypothetical protein VHD39_01040 [Acidimicrobiales bacterium]|nr:hypothetical protein [Acidimicrobiales bacterium]
MIDILPGADAGHCTLRHGWMANAPGVLQGCGQAARDGQFEHMVIGRNEIAVQHVVTTFQEALAQAG